MVDVVNSVLWISYHNLISPNKTLAEPPSRHTLIHILRLLIFNIILKAVDM